MQELNLEPDDLTVIGFNSNDAEIQYLRSGVLDALIVQNPYNMGYIGVYYAGQIVRGSSAAQSEDTGVTYVTMDNLDTDGVKLILDPTEFTK